MTIGPIQLIRQATPGQRRTLLAAALGWALDAFDAMLYALVLALLMRDLGMSKTTAGLLGTLTLLASGMGGEWNTGATLVAESWPTELRAKAISLVQSSWALGFAVAALVAGPVSRYFGWRAVFFVGILPALLTLWIRRGVPESAMWQGRPSQGNRRASSGGSGHAGSDVTSDVSSRDMKFSVIFRPPYVKATFALLLFNFCGMFAWWGLFTWLPPYLSLPNRRAGVALG